MGTRNGFLYTLKTSIRLISDHVFKNFRDCSELEALGGVLDQVFGWYDIRKSRGKPFLKTFDAKLPNVQV